MGVGVRRDCTKQPRLNFLRLAALCYRVQAMARSVSTIAHTSSGRGCVFNGILFSRPLGAAFFVSRVKCWSEIVVQFVAIRAQQDSKRSNNRLLLFACCCGCLCACRGYVSLRLPLFVLCLLMLLIGTQHDTGCKRRAR